MPLVRMDIQSVVVGGGPMASLVVLKPRSDRDGQSNKLPIRIGRVEAAAISMGVNGARPKRPMTHDLLQSTISTLGATLEGVAIVNVLGTTFYAQLMLGTPLGDHVCVDARPSDAIALAVRAHVPIFAENHVLDTAALPDFGSVERDELAREAEAFHEFVENLSPEDFSTQGSQG